MKSEIIFEDKFFELVRYSGVVVDNNQRTSTEVSGGGGDFGVSIRSRTHETTEFFLMDDDGKERSFEIHNWDFSMRVGHHIEVYGLFAKSSNTGGYVLGA